MLHDQLNVLEQGTRVEFDVQGIVGNGKIVGCAQLAGSTLGEMYIIEPDKWPRDISPGSSYKYSHFVAFRCHLKLIEEKVQ